ncbi:MAG: FGGY-family carbohydrate kinase [Candidatus Binatia bacterium]|nr:FGGY-family carbohydrate kinase [Candidatus Binatia bacterium]
MDFFLAIDAGTGSGKCVVFDAHGKLRARAAEEWTYEVTPDPELPSVKWFSFNPNAFWATLCRCIRAAVEQAGAAPKDIAGIAATSQREACVFVDHRGIEVYAGPNIDARGFREGMDVLQVFGAERLYRITGHSAPFIFPLCRYLWYRKRSESEVSRILMMNDWIHWRLTGEFVSEPSNATESMLFDVAGRTWAAQILEAFSIPRSLLPDIRQPGEQAGNLRADVAETLGLLPGTPVFVGGADTQCSLLGAGVLDPGVVGATLGTTTPVQAVTDELCLDPQSSLWAGCHVVPDRWVLESNAGDTGDAYRWLIDLLRGDQPHEVARTQLEAAAAACPDTSAILFVGPSVFDIQRIALRRPGGILFPYPTLHVRPSAKELMRAFFESVGFALRANLEQLERVLGTPPRRIVLSGGMTRNLALLRILADVLGRPLQVANEPESAALGCAILMASGGNLDKLRSTAQSWVQHQTLEPAPNCERYAARYETWRRLYEQFFDLEL